MPIHLHPDDLRSSLVACMHCRLIFLQRPTDHDFATHHETYECPERPDSPNLTLNHHPSQTGSFTVTTSPRSTGVTTDDIIFFG